MRKTAVFILVATFLNLFIFSFSSCKKNRIETNDAINKTMLCTLPKSSQILHKTSSTYAWGFRIQDLGAKISMTKDDYNTFITSLTNEYQKCNISDCTYTIVNDSEYLCIPDSVGNFIGFESVLYSWWDLNAQEIDYIYYMDSQNALGAKHVSTRRIYVIDLQHTVFVYLSFME